MRTRGRTERGGWVRWMLLAVLYLGLGLLPAAARPTYPDVVASAYSLKPNGKLVSASCNLCHVSTAPPVMNPYGNDVKSVLTKAGTSVLTPALLKSIETRDSDQDGAAN